MPKIERRCNLESELRMTEVDGTVTFTGYAAIFNSFSSDMGGWKEIIRPGAFTKSLSKNPDVRFLINHEDLPLARTPKTLTLHEDSRGLRVETVLDKTDPDVQRLIPKMRRGDMNQMSFAFRTIVDTWRKEPSLDIRELQEVDINEGDVSVVTYPAYPATEASLRGLDVTVASQEYELWKNEQQQAIEMLKSQQQARERHLHLLRQ